MTQGERKEINPAANAAPKEAIEISSATIYALARMALTSLLLRSPVAPRLRDLLRPVSQQRRTARNAGLRSLRLGTHLAAGYPLHWLALASDR